MDQLRSIAHLPSRARILLGAVKVFGEVGLHDATMEAIAAAAGVSRRTIYYAFENKVELVAEVMDAEMRRILDEAKLKLDLSLPADELIATAEAAVLECGVRSPLVAIVYPDSVGLTWDTAVKDRYFTDLHTSYWRPVLDHLESQGALRSDVSRAQIMKWIIAAHFMFICRPETFTESRDVTSETLRLFLAPSILSPEAQLGR